MEKKIKELLSSIRSAKKQGLKDNIILEKTYKTLETWINTK